jgi:hypothetical protein
MLRQKFLPHLPGTNPNKISEDTKITKTVEYSMVLVWRDVNTLRAKLLLCISG